MKRMKVIANNEVELCLNIFYESEILIVTSDSDNAAIAGAEDILI